MAENDALNFECPSPKLQEISNSQATKEDLANLKADLIKWFIGTQIALAALVIYLLQ